MKVYTTEQSAWSHFLFTNTKTAPLWLVVRLYVGYIWFMAGWEKLQDPVWNSGQALNGFVQNALTKTTGPHPDVAWWYAHFLQSSVLAHLSLWTHLVPLGELCIGLGLMFGLFVGAAAFFSVFMSYNFLLAGTVSINPILIFFGFLLMLARRVAGRIGLDRYIAPRLRKLFR